MFTGAHINFPGASTLLSHIHVLTEQVLLPEFGQWTIEAVADWYPLESFLLTTAFMSFCCNKTIISSIALP